jgi:hypothetical protein
MLVGFAEFFFICFEFEIQNERVYLEKDSDYKSDLCATLQPDSLKYENLQTSI